MATRLFWIFFTGAYAVFMVLTNDAEVGPWIAARQYMIAGYFGLAVIFSKYTPGKWDDNLIADLRDRILGKGTDGGPHGE